MSFLDKLKKWTDAEDYEDDEFEYVSADDYYDDDEDDEDDDDDEDF